MPPSAGPPFSSSDHQQGLETYNLLKTPGLVLWQQATF